MTDYTSKRCPRCKNIYPLTVDFWHHNRRTKFSGWCKTCRAKNDLERRRARGVQPHTKAEFEDFIKFPDMIGTDECWEWFGGRSRRGYGNFAFNGKQYRANRFAYERYIGPIPDGLWVLHRCDNPPCCNPDHLFLGTNLDNVRDKIQKGRQQQGSLDEIKVREMRKLYEAGVSTRQIAKLFGVSAPHAWRVVTRREWAHIG